MFITTLLTSRGASLAGHQWTDKMCKELEATVLNEISRLLKGSIMLSHVESGKI